MNFNKDILKTAFESYSSSTMCVFYHVINIDVKPEVLNINVI